MALDPLATTDDLDARTIAWEDQALAELYLGVASESVREAAGCPISRLTSTVELWGDDCGTRLRLPGQPVISVTSVVLDGDTLVAGTDYVLQDGELYRPAGWRSAGLLPTPATVILVHGLADVPVDVVDLVCRMTASALRAVAAAAGGEGLAVDDVASERIGDYSVSYDRESGMTEMDLSERTRNRLRARFGGGAAMVTTR